VAGIVAKLRFEFEIVLALRRQDFVPWPRVSSVVLAMRKRPTPLLVGRDAAAFARFVERGFGRGRVSLRQNLGKTISAAQLAMAARELDFDIDGPPRELSFEQWLGLFGVAIARRALHR
jgi:16S rRNA A1518/A1519 N6-dimethyltransferase RsmA/KsgA/DIM1 with predicted DNA glycosylase/AP lyase activity